MSVWAKIETAPASASLFSWKLRFGTELTSVAPWFLKTAGRTATSVPCPYQCGCFHRVTEDGSAVCNCGDCEPIPLSEEDIKVWEPNWSNLGTRIRDAFELEHKTSQFPVRKVWQVGSFGGDALQIVLVVQPDRVAFNEALAQLVARVKGFVVLTPTATHRDLESRELLARVNSGIVDLESNVTILASGRFVAQRSAGELFSRFLPEVKEAIADDEAKRVFALRKKFRQSRRKRKAPLGDVFDLLVLEGRSQEFVAREFDCSPGLISLRVDEIAERMKRSLPELRAMAARLGEMSAAERDPRARMLYRKGQKD